MAKKSDNVHLVKKEENLNTRYNHYNKEEFIDMIEQACKKVPKDLQHTIYFEIKEYGYPYDETIYHDLFMNYSLPENEDEKKQRLAKEAEEKARKARIALEDKERQEFLKWKAEQKSKAEQKDT